MRHLGVIAGASCAGKTTLLNALQKNKVQALITTLDFGNGDDWEIRDAWEWDGAAPPALSKDNVIVHYDLFRPLSLAVDDFDFSTDAVLASLLSSAQRVTVIALWDMPQRLRGRSRQRERQVWWELLRHRDYSRFKTRMARRKRMRPWYEPERLQMVYDQWFEFCHAADVHDIWVYRTTAQDGPVRWEARGAGIALWDSSSKPTGRSRPCSVIRK